MQVPKDKLALGRLMAAIDKALHSPAAFPQAVLAQAIQQMEVLHPWPPLFMRSVMQVSLLCLGAWLPWIPCYFVFMYFTKERLGFACRLLFGRNLDWGRSCAQEPSAQEAFGRCCCRSMQTPEELLFCRPL